MTPETARNAEVAAFIAAELPARSRVLEVGCGRGAVAAALAAAGHEVTALDLELRDLVAAPGVRFVERDFLAYDDAPFDAIAFTSSLHHIAPLDAALDRARALVRVGGVLVIDEFDLAAPDAATLRWYEDTQELLAATGCYDPDAHDGGHHHHGQAHDSREHHAHDDHEHRDHEHRDAGHRDAGHRDAGHRDAGHRDAGHRDEGHRDEGHREPPHDNRAHGQDDLVARWRQAHHHDVPLHEGDAMQRGLAARFRVRTVMRGPYLFRRIGRKVPQDIAGARIAACVRAIEERGIAGASLRAVGLRLVCVRDA